MSTTTPSHIETIRKALKQCDMRINSQDRATHNRIDAALASLEALLRQPAQLVMSTDYEALYEHLKAGGEAISYVHYERSEGMPQSRNLCGAKRMPNGTTLLSGGSVQEIMSLHLNAFVSECQRLNLEWVAPRQPAQTEDLEAEIEAIDKVLHFRAYKMTPGEAVKWLHELYTEQCVTLHEAAQRHKIGHGGEKLAKVASDALDSLTTQVRELREAAQVAADALDNFDGSVGYGSDSVFQTITWKKDDINPYAARIAAQEALSRLAELNIKPANTSDL